MILGQTSVFAIIKVTLNTLMFIEKMVMLLMYDIGTFMETSNKLWFN